ncbi:MAG: glucokinase [Oligoflexales bacterium]|nr:glucokinase [Oligoflexales bacterium]
MTMKNAILVGDIGGTKIKMALVSRDEFPHILATKEYQSSKYANFTEIIKAFREEFPHTPFSASIGCAGPVEKGVSKVTNLPWTVDVKDLISLGYQKSWLLNDLFAHAHGLCALEKDGILTIQKGEIKEGNRALIAAGTGLGESILLFNNGSWIPSASEGGHTNFGPSNETEIELLRFLMQQYDHVSWERVVSGRFGFLNIVKFLISSGRYQVDMAFRKKIEEENDIGEFIFESAEKGLEISVCAMKIFSRLYGCEAGDLALKALAVGGVYVGGGIASKILPWIKEHGFLEGFNSKGRFKGMMEKMPVHIVVDKEVALKGAAVVATNQI